MATDKQYIQAAIAAHPLIDLEGDFQLYYVVNTFTLDLMPDNTIESQLCANGGETKRYGAHVRVFTSRPSVNREGPLPIITITVTERQASEYPI